jgi:hypothetical protein
VLGSFWFGFNSPLWMASMIWVGQLFGDGDFAVFRDPEFH